MRSYWQFNTSMCSLFVFTVPSSRLHVSIYIIMLEYHHTSAYWLHMLVLQVYLLFHGTSQLLHGQVNFGSTCPPDK